MKAQVFILLDNFTMNFIASVTLIFLLCATDFTRSKSIDDDEKDGQGTHFRRASHQNTSFERAERRSLRRYLKDMIAMGQKAILLPYQRSDNYIYIPEKESKKIFMEKALGIPREIMTDDMLNLELIASQQSSSVYLMDTRYNIPLKAIKVYDPHSAKEMSTTKTSEYPKQTFKSHGVKNLWGLYKHNPMGVEIGHYHGGRLSTESLDAYKASYSLFNTAPMFPEFNKFFFWQVENKVLKFVEQAGQAGKTTFYMVGVSPDCFIDAGGKVVKGILKWLGNPGDIVIPHSVYVIAVAVPTLGANEPIEVFAWFGKNDKYEFKETSYFVKKVEELYDLLYCTGDQSSVEGINRLIKMEYQTWQPPANI